MNLTDDMILKFQKGSPVLLDDICAIFPRTIGDIVDEGYSNFQQYLSILTSTKPVALDESNGMAAALKDLTDFQYLLVMSAFDPQINDLIKRGFRFFVKDEITISLEPAQIIIGPLEEKHILDEEKFYDFQAILRRMYFLDVDEPEIIIYPDDSPMIKRMKMKMRENREKVKRAKAKQAAQKKSDINFSDLIGSITINHCNINMENVWNLTYYAFHDQLKRMGWRDQFNINSQAAMAGAKISKKQLQHWVRSIANSET